MYSNLEFQNKLPSMFLIASYVSVLVTKKMSQEPLIYLN